MFGEKPEQPAKEVEMDFEAQASRFAARAAFAAVTVALLAAAPIRAEEPNPAQTREIMREVFVALQRVLPASLDERRFADPALRPEILAALKTLSRHAERLAVHGSGGGASFVFLSGSLAREAREIERRYAAGRFREAQFELHEFTENCVACHSRLPDQKDAELSSRFMDQAEIDALPLPERAQLAMATRQFERALAAHEAMLTSPEFDVSSIDLLGYLDDYLEVCVRVKNDFERPARALEAFAKRGGVRQGVRDDVKHWVADLRELRARGPIEGLAAGRRLVEEAERASQRLEARALLVRYQAASGTLHRFVASLPERDPRAAEAYYWLGVIESRVGRSFWLSQTEPYLEAAIRLAPGDPLAEKAYTLLEEFVVSGYTGSSGDHIPEDVKAWLDDLARLIATTKGRKTSSHDDRT
jgi:tetratricopeptide (TPR) repeat protein